MDTKNINVLKKSGSNEDIPVGQADSGLDPKSRLQAQAKEAMIRQKVELSGQPQTINGKYIYVDPTSGSVKTIVLSQQQQQVADAKYALETDRLKRSGDVNAWLNATNDYVSTLKDRLGKLDPVTQQPDILSLENKIADLSAQTQKYQSQGGFAKGRKKSIKGAKFSTAIKKTKALSFTKTSRPSKAIKLPSAKTLSYRGKPFSKKGTSL